MAPLPVALLNLDEPPFSRVGIDYFGPVQVCVGRSTLKRWGVIVTSLNCIGMHFKISHFLNTDPLLAAFTRIIARRGVPQVIFTENGINFVAAEQKAKRDGTTNRCKQGSAQKWGHKVECLTSTCTPHGRRVGETHSTY